ncbi:MAG: UDP-N-acetylmuramoyl-L-alanine--D-glutamate ligase [Candidatus Woykebacteria bacterium]
MNFSGKKVAVVGAGIEGFSTLHFLSGKGSTLYLFDRREEGQIGKQKLQKASDLGAVVVTGKHYLDGLADFDIIFRSPGVRPDLPQIVEAKRRGAIITSQTKLFFDLCPAPIIGVTGTKGKGTTVTLISDILKSAGKKVLLGGNIGEPPLNLIQKVTSDSLIILELSSFQLIDLEKSPHVAVILMITTEHLDWHKDVYEYRQAKERIVKYQTETDYVVIDNDFPASREIGEISKAKKYYYSSYTEVKRGAYFKEDSVFARSDDYTTKIIDSEKIKIPGEHNIQNITASIAAASILKIPHKVTAQAIGAFKGLPHRLELVAEINGVKYYNDSASTTPETAIAAINSFKEPKIIILGGSSKQADFSNLGKKIVESNIKGVILIGEEAKRIENSIKKSGHFEGSLVKNLTSMRKIVESAKNLASNGDVIVLSPASASFDMFENYEARGEKFKEAVNSFLD